MSTTELQTRPEPVGPSLDGLALDGPIEVPAALEAPPAKQPEPDPSAQPNPVSPSSATGLPLHHVAELLRKIATTGLGSVEDLLPIARILGLAVVAGIALKITGATLGAINELPLIGGLLELVGLVSLLRFLAKNALHQQKRAELLARIETIRKELLG
jgi:hypothetical protein